MQKRKYKLSPEGRQNIIDATKKRLAEADALNQQIENMKAGRRAWIAEFKQFKATNARKRADDLTAITESVDIKT